MATVTNFANAYQSVLTADMSPTDLVASVESTDRAPTSPCYLVIDPENSKREYILFDGSFTTTTFSATTINNRYLSGSAASSGITHAAGAVVRFAPVAQHFNDLHGRIDSKANDTDVVKLAGAQTVTGAKTFSVDPTLADGSSALSQDEGNAAYAAANHGHAAAAITNTAAGNIASTDVQAALNELDTEKTHAREGAKNLWVQSTAPTALATGDLWVDTA